MRQYYVYMIMLISLSFIGLIACNNADTSSDSPSPIDFIPIPGQPLDVISFGYTESTDTIWTFGSELRSGAFDLSDYPSYSRITFKAEIASTKSDVKCFARLYNLTDGEPLVESEVSNTFGQTPSENIISLFPNKEIQLALQLRSENPEVTVALRYNSVLEISPE
ncbi:MAG: hypothetical protein AAF824_11455 [Bacteroidota bacterium]